MDQSTQNSTDRSADLHASQPTDAGHKLTALSSLLENIDEAPAPVATPRHKSEAAHQNQLVQVRLGIASSLFAALRVKHPPTAAHGLRVALGCSSWTLNLDLTDTQRDEIEVAALLHDIGKIGVPDKILTKPGRLTGDETACVESQRQKGLEILASCCASRELLDIVRHATAWYDGSRETFDRRGDQLPLGARMLAIVDAFDSMTTDHVWRRALSRDRAVAELFEYAGRQFDPHLTKEFCALLSTDQVKFTSAVARRWLQDLNPQSSNALWSMPEGQGAAFSVSNDASTDALFQRRLLDGMQDAVVFVDRDLRILYWNRAAERMTGLTAASVHHKQWSPSLVQLSDDYREAIAEADCPVAEAIASGSDLARRYLIAGREGAEISVDIQLQPVANRNGHLQGITLLMHDASSQITLEERVQSLHEKATRDPLTSVANRAEFDRVQAQFIETHLQRKRPCSLVICDIDFFKRINDTYGHQAGDEALISFAALMRRHRRPGDLVARYGGEEFVLLCTDCDNATATARAEEIRRELAATPQQMLGSKCITASFGVTEIQEGDTPDTMLRRADRALLQAKDLGRNTVVQLGAGLSGGTQRERRKGWFSWLTSSQPDQLLQRQLITPVPLKVVVEKLRGFVADHHAEIVSIEEQHIVLKIDGQHTPLQRRTQDRAVPFCIDLHITETEFEFELRQGGTAQRTLIDVAVRPQRNRDRRRRDVVERAKQLISSLKSYLMAQDHSSTMTIENDEDESGGVWSKFKGMFSRPAVPHGDDR